MTFSVLHIRRNEPHRLNDAHFWDRGYFTELRALGVRVEERGAVITDGRADVGDVAGFDYVYLWSCNQPHWSLPAAAEVKRQGGRLIVLPVWWHPGPMHRYAGIQDNLDYLLAAGAVLRMADSLHVRTMSEAVECWKLAPGAPAFLLGTGYYEQPVAPMPEPATRLEIGNAVWDFPAGYVCCVGDIHLRKNQLNLARACRLAGLPLVCVGPPFADGYLGAVQAEGARLTGPLSPVDTLRILAGARVAALVSFFDNVAQANLEACWLEVPTVMSYVGCEVDYFSDGGIYCDPTDVADIARALVTAWQRPRGRWAQMQTWQEVAERGLAWMEANK